MEIKDGKILIVDDDRDVLKAAELYLKQHVGSVVTSKTPQKIPDCLAEESFDVILLDMNFTRDASSGKEGFYWLKRILEIEPTAVVIMITAFGDVEMSVKAIKKGATDFVLKPWQNEKLLATISSAMKLKKSRQEIDSLKTAQKLLSEDADKPFQEFVGSSDAMDDVFKTIKKVAQTDANVLILGENGTGKELVARALHRHSLRRDRVFMSVDMGAITETLFESELFGHVKGAFTDAREDRPGRFETASGGTLFLDEIGNLSLPLQAKLLTVLQNRQIARVGSDKSIQFDIRLICATNMPIHDMVQAKEFRQDLLYRINTVEICLPPLRDRMGDLPELIDHFLRTYCKKYNKPRKGISSTALKKLQAYKWPGNVRELQHAIERAVILCETPQLQGDDFFFARTSGSDEEMAFDNLNLEGIEKTVILKVLNKHHGNITNASKELGLTRTSLYRRLEKYGI